MLQVVEDTHVEAVARPCAVHVLHSEGCPLRGDANLLRRVIENVVRNAICHTSPSSDVTIQLSCGEDSVAYIVVEDSGPGIPDAELDRIFEPFYRVDASRRRTTGGFGLGLSIAQRSVGLHGARLRRATGWIGKACELRFISQQIPQGIHQPERRRPTGSRGNRYWSCS